MKETKVQFSATERELMCNSEIILTKNRVVEKVKTLLEELQNEMTGEIQNNSRLLSTDVFSVPAKISKGENYLGLPYLILDYPRTFKQESSFAIRTMFWWGNFFSSTLHLSGTYKQQYASKIAAAFKTLSTENYSIGINSDPWLHHFGPDNYKLISLLRDNVFEEECRKAIHLKIAKRFALNENGWQQKIYESWKLLTGICFD
jgi:hypothetical protein